jgi:hypothetical protein
MTYHVADCVLLPHCSRAQHAGAVPRASPQLEPSPFARFKAADDLARISCRAARNKISAQTHWHHAPEALNGWGQPREVLTPAGDTSATRQKMPPHPVLLCYIRKPLSCAPVRQQIWPCLLHLGLPNTGSESKFREIVSKLKKTKFGTFFSVQRIFFAPSGASHAPCSSIRNMLISSNRLLHFEACEEYCYKR